MPNPVRDSLSERRIFTYLQNSFAKKTQWLVPLPWKPNFKFLFDQAYMKDIKLKQEVQYDSLEKEGEALSAGNNFTFRLLSILSQLELRLVTIEGATGYGKTALVNRFLKDWLRVAPRMKNATIGSVFLHCDLSSSVGLTSKGTSSNSSTSSSSSRGSRNFNQQKLDLTTVMDLFDIPGFLYDDFMWLVERYSENVIILLETDDIQKSTRLIFKLFYKVFPYAKFLVFYRPDVLTGLISSTLPKSKEYRYLMRRRLKLRIHGFDAQQTVTLVKQTSLSSVLFQNFRDALHEHDFLCRLCSNPFVTMVVLNMFKENRGMRFLDNKLTFFRKILVAMWRRYAKTSSEQCDVEIIEHIDSLLITLSEIATETYTTNCHLPKDVLLHNEHSVLLLESGLLVKHQIGLNDSSVYTFFDPLLHEYACALHFTSRLDRIVKDQASDISNILFSSEWKNVCVLVAAMLGKQFSLLLRQVDFDYMEDSALNILSDSLHQCQCPRLCLKDVQRIPIPQSIDFADLPITTSTLKGLQILLDWSYDNSSSSRCGSNSSIPSIMSSYQSKRASWNPSNFSKHIDFRRPHIPHQDNNIANQHNDQSRRDWMNGSNDSLLNTSNHQNNNNSNHNNNYNVEKYNSCPNLNYTFANALRLSHFDDEELGEVTNAALEFEEEDQHQSWGNHYQAHLNKQKSMANLTNLLDHNGNNRSNNIKCVGGRTTLHQKRNRFHGSIFRTESWKDNMFNSSASLFSSFESLSNVAVERERNYIKELRIKGSCIGNRIFTSLLTFLQDNNLERLFLMDQNEYDFCDGISFSISSKLVDRFLDSITEMSELSINSNLLGESWIDTLIKLISDNVNLLYLSIAVVNLEDLNVEGALKLAKALQKNKNILQFEIFCGAQSIVVQTSLGFFVDIMEKDSRTSVIFL